MSRIATISFALIVVAAWLAPTAGAAALDNAADWDSLGPIGKIGYVAGAVDQQAFIPNFDDLAENTKGSTARAMAIRQCLDSTRATYERLVGYVDEKYKEAAMAQTPPREMVDAVLHELCYRELRYAGFGKRNPQQVWDSLKYWH